MFVAGIDDLQHLAQHVLDTFAVEVSIFKEANGIPDAEEVEMS